MPSGWAKALIMYKIMQFGQRADDDSPKRSRPPTFEGRLQTVHRRTNQLPQSNKKSIKSLTLTSPSPLKSGQTS